VETQLLQLREFAARMNWETVHENVDKVSGAKSENRPQLKKMFAAASRREFDLVLFWALDRFSREGTLATLNYLQQLDSYGVGYRSYAEQYIDSTGSSRMS
jgi:DNA invertase Pin-like site-specific DNA recombinase